MLEAPWWSTLLEVITASPSPGCSIGLTWTRAVVCRAPATTQMSLQWLVGVISLNVVTLFFLLKIDFFKGVPWILLRYPLPVDVLAQLQLSHYGPWGRAAPSSYQHLPGFGLHCAHHCRHLQPLQQAWKTRHGTHMCWFWGPTVRIQSSIGAGSCLSWVIFLMSSLLPCRSPAVL